MPSSPTWPGESVSAETVISLEEARQRILAACSPLPPARLDLAGALGCVLASEVVAGADVPPFTNSAMDGYAVRSADTEGAGTGSPRRLEVVASIPAGTAPSCQVGPGQAARIMTGAALPPGADSVVMVEATRGSPGAGHVEILSPARPGDHVRSAGDDIRAGQSVFGAGTVLGPGHLGVLASLGLARAHVHRRARVGVLSTGDELADAADPAPLRPGQIRDSNRPTLLAMATQAGAEPVDLGRVSDVESVIEARLAEAARTCDLVLTSGGVSVGDYDYVKVVLDRLGVAYSWQVAIKPAKPLAFAVVSGTPVLGLPGNPVSSMVAFELFARPALRLLMGHPEPVRPAVAGVTDGHLRRRPDGKLHLVRVTAAVGEDGRWHVTPSGGQGSHMLRSMALANALALVPDGDGIPAGEAVDVLVLA